MFLFWIFLMFVAGYGAGRAITTLSSSTPAREDIREERPFAKQARNYLAGRMLAFAIGVPIVLALVVLSYVDMGVETGTKYSGLAFGAVLGIAAGTIVGRHLRRRERESLKEEETGVSRKRVDPWTASILLLFAVALVGVQIWEDEPEAIYFDQLAGAVLGSSINNVIESEGPPEERWICATEARYLSCLIFTNSPNSGNGRLEVCAADGLVVSVAYRFPESREDPFRPKLADFDEGPTWSDLPDKYEPYPSGAWRSRCSTGRLGWFFGNNIFLMYDDQIIRYGVSSLQDESLRNESLRQVADIGACCRRAEDEHSGTE